MLQRWGRVSSSPSHRQTYLGLGLGLWKAWCNKPSRKGTTKSYDVDVWPFKALPLPIDIPLEGIVEGAKCSTSSTSTIFKIFLMFIHFLRERDRVWAGEGQRERETQNPKMASGLSHQHRARCRARTQKRWDHDLSQSGTLNLPSHPGAPPQLPL